MRQSGEVLAFCYIIIKILWAQKSEFYLINHCSSISASKVKSWRNKSIWVSSTKAVVEQPRPPVISTLFPKVNWWAFTHQMSLRPSATTTALITASLSLLQRWPFTSEWSCSSWRYFNYIIEWRLTAAKIILHTHRKKQTDPVFPPAHLLFNALFGNYKKISTDRKLSLSWYS